jgi:Tol biopolymer transport system component
VFAQRIGGRNAILIAGDPARAEGGPVFSPDGASIAFHDGNGIGGIFVTGATGESTRRVTDFGFHPAWSPDGHRLLFCTEAVSIPQSRSIKSALWVVDAKGGTPTKLSDGDAVQPVWSPSGKQIAYWAVDTGQRDLFTMPAAGGPRVAVTHDAAIDWSPQWSPDGRYLYFSSDRGGAMNVWRLPMDESSGKPIGEPEAITSGVASADQLSLSHDGRRIVFRSLQSSNNPAAVAFDPAAETIGAPKQILDRSGSMVPSGVSPDGKWLVLWNILEYQEDVFIARTDGSELRRLTDDPYRDRAGVFSPDGKEIAFYSNRSDSYNIFAIKPDGSGLHALTERSGGNDQNLLYPTYSPKGDQLITSHVRTPETLLLDPRKAWTAQKAETFDMRFPDGSWLMPTSWSPDGRRWLGGITNGAGANVGVGVFDVATKSLRRISSEPTAAATLSAAWLPDSRRAIVTELEKENLVVVDADTGRRKELGAKLGLGIGLVIAPDGRTIYVSSARQQADIWMAMPASAAEKR